MAERNIDALVVEGPDGFDSANPDFNYFVKSEHVNGVVIKKRGAAALLVHHPWERVQAEATGLELISSERWNRREIARDFPDRVEAAVELRRRMFRDLGVSGRVGFYGTVHSGRNYTLLTRLAQTMPDLEIVGEFDKDILTTARLTKDAHEAEQMRRVGRKTCAVVQAVVDYLRSGRAQGGLLVTSEGRPITIGMVKRLINRELSAAGLEAPIGIIFSQGRDSALPHAEGDDAAPLRLGEALSLDLVPREINGYWHDMTRTFALGYASPELHQIYDQVQEILELVVANLKVGEPTRTYQEQVCAYFEERNHPTIRSVYPLEEGYIHDLGHGIGLEVHEQLLFSTQPGRDDVIAPGAVFTLEPGLYYADQGFGVRLEDVYYCRPEGDFECLTPFPKQLVIAVEG
ncbi:MAG TPA: M24 family metallopeptidase [Roseiflexaceae bacterium]|nr:M24 family metallopeptidase [Roseiflexaceae bacterium]